MPDVIGEPVAGRSSPRICATGWQERKEGDCWTQPPIFNEGPELAYVHPKGWIIYPQCFHDTRFTGQEVIDALSVTWNKMDPKVSVKAGGCLSKYNPQWGRKMTEAVWDKHMVIRCPERSSSNNFCGAHETRDLNEIDGLGGLRFEKRLFSSN